MCHFLYEEKNHGEFTSTYYTQDKVEKDDDPFIAECYEPKSLFLKNVDSTPKSRSWRNMDSNSMSNIYKKLNIYSKKYQFDPMELFILDLYSGKFTNTVIIANPLSLKYIFRSLVKLNLKPHNPILKSENDIISFGLPSSKSIQFLNANYFFDVNDYSQDYFIPFSLVPYLTPIPTEIPDESLFFLRSDSSAQLSKKAEFVRSYEGKTWNGYDAIKTYLRKENERLLFGALDIQSLAHEVQESLEGIGPEKLPQSSCFNWHSLISFGHSLLMQTTLCDPKNDIRVCPHFDGGDYSANASREEILWSWWYIHCNRDHANQIHTAFWNCGPMKFGGKVQT